MATPGNIVKCSTLSQEEQDIVRDAIDAKSNAYCPYSNFKVGASLIAGSGTKYKGCNVENAAYPLSTCAERTAIAKAASEGERSIRSIAVVTDTEQFLAPCGGCRQIIAEFGYKNNCMVLMVKNPGNECIKTSIQELLPLAFTPESLEN